MAATIWGEARGETYPGKLAVAWAIRNRVEKPSWWSQITPADIRREPVLRGIGNNTITAVCRKPMQFSAWNAGDPNRDRLLELANDDFAFIALGNAVYRDCLSAALDVISGRAHDATEGSTHYRTAAVAPAWSRGQRQHAQIGNHLFYTDIA